ncbi:MAG: 4Fe-4S binding protein [Spirochaetes bacterium]|nr:4Fe-4S binding protein [Spirochaetota bacterium]
MSAVYRELSKKLLLENSTILHKIWQIVCSEQEAHIVNMLPATIDEIAARTNKSHQEIEKILNELYHRGVVFEGKKGNDIVYRAPRHIIQFHDATLLWDEAPEELLQLWVEFMEKEYPTLLELVTKVNFPSFMRVVPINRTINPKSAVLTYEDAESMIRNAATLAVTRCVCRLSLKRCNNPLENCLQLNKGAEYTIKRGTGRKIDVDEALRILKEAEDHGLVHLTENRAVLGNAICNCCSCCCEMLRFATNTHTKGVLAPSRFVAEISPEACTSCGNCVEICPMKAVGENAQGQFSIQRESCIGCGLCANNCPTSAIFLQEIRPKEFIPA